MSEHARHRGKVLRIVGFNGIRELNAYVDSQGPRWKAQGVNFYASPQVPWAK